MITVIATTVTGRALLWEPRPGGDNWIAADGRAYTVELTPAVQRLLDQGLVVQASPAPHAETFAEPDPRVAHGPPRRKR